MGTRSDSAVTLDSDAHLWLLPVRPFGSGPAVLSAQERERAGRFRFPEHRELYAFSHTALRRILARLLHRAPEAIEFETGPNGRPELRCDRTLRFNLSHTAGWTACLVTASGDCGVDIESRARAVDPDLTATSVLTPRELEDLRRIPDPSLRLCRFLAYWTLKEAYVKALGLGLSAPVAEIGFRSPEQEPALEHSPFGTGGWRFWTGVSGRDANWAVAWQGAGRLVIHHQEEF